MSNRFRIDIKPYEELTRDELHDVLMLRNIVFVVGQGITSEPEVDGRDPECEHAMMWEGDTLVGTARIFHRQDPQVIGRVAVLTDRQGEGLGTDLMRAVQQHIGESHAELHAQAHLEAWYTRLGWVRVGDVFEEANIPHVMMRWPD
jgi:ElaA protein